MSNFLKPIELFYSDQRKLLVFSLALTALFLASLPGAEAQFASAHELLGVEVLKEKSKRGNIRPVRRGTVYSGIMIEVQGGSKIVKRITVKFEDRSSETFNESRLNLQKGRSNVLWFRSRDQVIDKISLLYFPDAGVQKGAEIRVYGVR